MLPRALTPANIINKKRMILQFEKDWLAAFGRIEANSRILVWGGSGQGKTRFVLQMAKYLSNFLRIAYNSLEMGDSMALGEALHQEQAHKNIIILNRENADQVLTRMKRRKSPECLIVDSLQYLRDSEGNGINYKRYIKFSQELPDKLLVFVSHADHKEPAGRVAKSIRYDVDVKIFVQGFKAFVTSRYGGGQPITIWEEGAKEYYGL